MIWFSISFSELLGEDVIPECVAASPHMSQSDKYAKDCQCSDFVYTCSDTDRYENVMQMMTMPQVMLQDVSHQDVDQYLVGSYYNYIDQR